VRGSVDRAAAGVRRPLSGTRLLRRSLPGPVFPV